MPVTVEIVEPFKARVVTGESEVAVDGAVLVGKRSVLEFKDRRYRVPADLTTKAEKVAWLKDQVKSDIAAHRNSIQAREDAEAALAAEREARETALSNATPADLSIDPTTI